MPRPDTVPGPDEATKVCPYCAEVIKAAAIKCRYCQSDLTGAPGQPVAPAPVTAPASAGTGPSTAPVDLGKPATPAQDRTETPVPGGPTGPAEDSEPDLRRSRWLLAAGALSLVLVLLFLTLAFLDWRSAREIAAAEDAARTVRASVTDKVEALLSYEHTSFDEDLEAAKEGMTPSFQEEYEPTVAEIRDRALAQERSQEADVVAVAVVSQSPEEVETLVFVNTISSREGSQNQRLMQNRVSVRMIKQDGTWLIDELSVPQS